ncbi:hypothetical protein RJ640_021752 [Escallonia rubra]|uniref:Interferon-related developmental regulator C-terminal domain-containing protein n=1 Tax=Escallonia rubra TaxID=112253 RepID=A0AA88QE29_9ASTE|nr:hypothetical protein RJ640_021752 [Escallonia rubra]
MQPATLNVNMQHSTQPNLAGTSSQNLSQRMSSSQPLPMRSDNHSGPIYGMFRAAPQPPPVMVNIGNIQVRPASYMINGRNVVTASSLRAGMNASQSASGMKSGIVNVVGEMNFVLWTTFGRIKKSTQLKELVNANGDSQSVEKAYIAFLFDGCRLRIEQILDEVLSLALFLSHTATSCYCALVQIHVEVADDGSLHIVACEALALIFEMGCLEKFASGTDGTDASSIHEGNVFPNRFSSIQELREKLLVRARALSLLAKVESSTTLSVKGKHNTEWDVLIILEENQLLHDVFDFTPKAKLSGDELYVSGREERIYRSPNSVFRKARTQILNKQRAIRAIAVEIATDSDANVKPALTSTPLKLDCCGAWGGYCKYALLICDKTVIFAWTTSGQCFPSKARNKA